MALAACLALTPWTRLAADPAADLIAVAKRGDTTAASAALRAGARKKGIPAAQALVAAAQRGDRAMTDLLVAAGVPVDETDEYSENALMNASFKGREELVAHLLERGAKATFVGHTDDGQEHIALIGAVTAGSVKIVKLLLDHGADPNAAFGAAVQMANFSGKAELYQPLKAAGGRDPEHPVMRMPGAREALAEFKAQAAKDAAANAGLITLLSTKPPPATARATPGKCRLAIIADEANAAAADLLTAQLSSSKTLEFVERAELDRVLAEQKLTRDLGAEAGARLAGLLGADALLLVSTREAANGRIVETRVVNVHPGLILASFFRPAPLADASGWAGEMAERLPALTTRAAAREGFALALLNVHATVDTPSAREMEKTANLLLGNRLLREPGFYVLERSAFDQIAQEIALGKKATDSFWTGSYTVDATLNPPLTAGDEIALTLRFRPGDGAAIEVQTRGPREKLAAVLDEAVSKIHAALTRTPPPAPAAQEAAHFVNEAHWQVQAGHYRQARQSMDTAWALGAHDFAARRYRLLCHAWALQIPICEAHARMVQMLPVVQQYDWPSRDYFNQPFRGDDFPSVAAAFEAAAEILRQYEDGWAEAASGDDARTAEWLDTGPDALQAACFIPILLDTAAMKMQHAEKLAQLRAAMAGMYRRVMAVTPPGSASALAYEELINEFARTLLVWPASFEQVTEAHRQMMALHFTGKGDFYSRARIRKSLCDATRFSQAIYRKPKDVPDRIGYTPFRWWVPMTPLQRQSLSAGYKTAEAADDRLFAWIDASRDLNEAPQAQQVALQMIMSIVWEVFPELARDQRLLGNFFYQSYCEPLGTVPRLTAAKGESYNNGNDSYFTPEIRAFRRKIFVSLAARQSDLYKCLYLLDDEKYSPAEAAEIIPALTAQLAGKPDGEMWLRYYCQHYGLPAPGEASNPAAMPKPLAITKFWEPSRLGLDPGRSFGISTRRMLWAEDRLWLIGDFFDRWMNEERAVPYVFSIEFPSMHATALPLPPEIPGETVGHGSLVVTPKRLIVAEIGYALLIYDRQKKTWETVPEIRPLDTPEILGDDLYLVIEGGLLRYDMEKRTVEVLSSKRRNPAQSPLDENKFGQLLVRWQPGPELEIRTTTEGKEDEWFGYSPLARTWRKIGPPFPVWHRADWKERRFRGFPGWAQVGFSKIEGPYFFSVENSPAPTMGIRLEFATDEKIEEMSRGRTSPPISIHPQDIIATKHGWIISEGGPSGKYLWFLPLADLKKYLRENPGSAKMIAEYETKTGMTLVPKDNP